MIPTPEDARDFGAGSPSASPLRFEDTLRLVAAAPVPAGLEERVHVALAAEPRTARNLAWPTGAWPSQVRAAAAATIVFVVAGGGWSIYTRVQRQAKTPSPQMVLPAGGFSSAGAIRTPDTVKGPPVQPVKTADTQAPAGQAQKLIAPEKKKQEKKSERHAVKAAPAAH